MSGIHFLRDIKSVKVKQLVELFEVFTGIDCANRYRILDDQGRDILFAAEKSSFMARWFLGSSRPLTMDIIYASTKTPFLKLDRPFRCTCFCLNPQEISVLDPNNGDARIGYVVQEWSLIHRAFTVYDKNDTPVYRISGSCIYCLNCICNRYSFHVFSASNPSDEGEIVQVWPGFLKAAYTNADNFELIFPPNATPEHKALLIAACFLIDYIYFERKQDNNSNID